MAAGVTDRLRDVKHLVALWKAYEQQRAEKTGSLMSKFRKAYHLYQAIGFTLLPLVVLYEVYVQRAPKVILISIPLFIGFAWVSYQTVKRDWNSK